MADNQPEMEQGSQRNHYIYILGTMQFEPGAELKTKKILIRLISSILAIKPGVAFIIGLGIMSPPLQIALPAKRHRQPTHPLNQFLS